MRTFYNGILDVSFPGTELTTDKITYTETGGWDWNFNVWPNCYKVIRKVNTILPHIDEVPDMNAFDKWSSVHAHVSCGLMPTTGYSRTRAP